MNVFCYYILPYLKSRPVYFATFYEYFEEIRLFESLLHEQRIHTEEDKLEPLNNPEQLSQQ